MDVDVMVDVMVDVDVDEDIDVDDKEVVAAKLLMVDK